MPKNLSGACPFFGQGSNSRATRALGQRGRARAQLPYRAGKSSGVSPNSRQRSIAEHKRAVWGRAKPFRRSARTSPSCRSSRAADVGASGKPTNSSSPLVSCATPRQSPSADRE